MKFRTNLLLQSCIAFAAIGMSLGSADAQSSSSQYESTAEAASGGASNLSAQFEVTRSVEQIKLIAGSSQRLKFNYQIPELLVENPEVISANAVSQNEISITGLKPGISSVTVSDPEKNLQTITVEVTIDTRKLALSLNQNFKDSKITVTPLNRGIMLSGYVARPDQIQNILKVSQDYFPDTEIVNDLQINGSQNIAIQVKVYEVSRSKLRQVGVDWSFFGENFSAVSSVAELIQNTAANTVNATGQNLTFGVLNNGDSFNAFIQALEQNNLAKLLDQPVLVAQNGRPAEFLSGGEFPISINQGLGNTTIEFKPFGTKLDIVPFIHGQGLMTLQVRAEVSEVDNTIGTASGVPGFSVRRVNTGVKMKAGHTLALAGDYRETVSAELRGLARIKDNPVLGPLFRRVEEETNETELLFLITPRFISEVDPSRVPRLGPGQLTTSPSDRELYINGYLEVPRCQDDCPSNNQFDNPAPVSAAPSSYSQQLIPQDLGPQVSIPQVSIPQGVLHQGVPQVVPQGLVPQGVVPHGIVPQLQPGGPVFQGQPQQLIPQAPQFGTPSISRNPILNRNQHAPTGAAAKQADAGGGFSWPLSRR